MDTQKRVEKIRETVDEWNRGELDREVAIERIKIYADYK